MNNELKDRHIGLALAGSFWSGSLDRTQGSLVRGLTHLADSNLNRELSFARARFDSSAFSNRESSTLYVPLEKVTPLNPELQQRVAVKYNGSFVVIRPVDAYLYSYNVDGHALLETAAAPEVIGSESSEVIAYPVPGSNVAVLGSIGLTDALVPRWVVPLGNGVRPLVLRSRKGDLVCGVDFLYVAGVLHFFENPAELFSLPYIPVVSYEQPTYSLMRYTLKIEAPISDVSPIVRYFRETQSAKTFEQAIAAAAGLLVIPREATVQVVIKFPSSTRYVFEDFVLEVDYPHAPLTLGTSYPEGYIIGQMVKVHGGDRTKPNWYRNINWSSGLSLDQVTPFRGLVAPDAQRKAETTTSAGNGKYHARVQLDGDPEVADKLWSYIAGAETRSGVYLADIIGISGQGSKSVNPIDLFFQSTLFRNALVVELRNMPSAAHLDRALRFIENEKPVGSVVITRIL